MRWVYWRMRISHISLSDSLLMYASNYLHRRNRLWLYQSIHSIWSKLSINILALVWYPYGVSNNIPEFDFRMALIFIQNINCFILLLIICRRCWDKYVVNQNETSASSSIPIGWIIPSVPCNPDWAKYLNNVNALWK